MSKPTTPMRFHLPLPLDVEKCLEGLMPQRALLLEFRARGAAAGDIVAKLIRKEAEEQGLLACESCGVWGDPDAKGWKTDEEGVATCAKCSEPKPKASSRVRLEEPPPAKPKGLAKVPGVRLVAKSGRVRL